MTLSATDGSAGHGPHVLEPQPDCVQVQWQAATQAEDRRRVLRWTCECRPMVYYLVTAGGQGYIERTGPGAATVQTARMRHVQVADLWELIWLGRAR
ncbi:hypothetical protein [Sphaerisporangium sp. NPDC051011]|uniref:hypothetical protein n=1 Tax=Sphaerisporangium sp. NPDC051011 TaxID=3155792 RepID=UPI00340EF3B9